MGISTGSRSRIELGWLQGASLEGAAPAGSAGAADWTYPQITQITQIFLDTGLANVCRPVIAKKVGVGCFQSR
jgi:hypothetical protein